MDAYIGLKYIKYNSQYDPAAEFGIYIEKCPKCE